MLGLYLGGTKNYGKLEALQNTSIFLDGVKRSCHDLESYSKER
jgi:hypothetical protein